MQRWGGLVMHRWDGSCRIEMGWVGPTGLGWGVLGHAGVGWGGSCRVSDPDDQNQICRESNLSTNIRVQELQGIESRHATGHQI